MEAIIIATLRYKNKNTGKWELVGVGGGDSTGGDQIVFSKKADFPATGDSSKIYIDTETSKSYIYVGGNYQLVGDGFSTTDWETIS